MASAVPAATTTTITAGNAHNRKRASSRPLPAWAIILVFSSALLLLLQAVCFTISLYAVTILSITVTAAIFLSSLATLLARALVDAFPRVFSTTCYRGTRPARPPQRSASLRSARSIGLPRPRRHRECRERERDGAHIHRERQRSIFDQGLPPYEEFPRVPAPPPVAVGERLEGPGEWAGAGGGGGEREHAGPVAELERDLEAARHSAYEYECAAGDVGTIPVGYVAYPPYGPARVFAALEGRDVVSRSSSRVNTPDVGRAF